MIQSSFWRGAALPALTTFFSMVYLLVVTPDILSHAGLPLNATFISLCLLGAVASIVSGLFSNTPIVYSSGLGLLSFFAYVVVGQNHTPWPQALAAVFCANVLLVMVSVTPVRRWLLQAIPASLGSAIAAGIGFFLGMLALHNVHFIVSNPATLVTLGHIHSVEVILFLVGFFLIASLDARKLPGSILIGVLVVSVLSWVSGAAPFKGVIALPHFSTETWGKLQFDHLWSEHSLIVVFTFFLVGLFDSTGSILGLLKTIPNCDHLTQKINRSLIVESGSSVLGALMGLTTCSPLLESSAGIRAGGQDGRTAIGVGILLLCSLFLFPLAQSVPTVAVSAALFYVACLMIRPLANIDWHDFTELVPAVVTLFTIPLTFSISDGVGIGVISYIVLKFSHGKWREVHSGLYFIGVLFILYFYFA